MTIMAIKGIIIATPEDYKTAKLLCQKEGFRNRGVECRLTDTTEEKLAELKAQYPDVRFKFIRKSS